MTDDRPAYTAQQPAPSAAAANTKTAELLSTTVGLLMGYREGAARQPYKPGSVVAKVIDEVVDHLKDWPYPEPSPAPQADSQPAPQGETNAQLDIDSNSSAPGQQRDVAGSVALGQPVGNGSDQAAGHTGAQGDKLLIVAERNIRSFLRSAVFKSESDREAALNCVDVLWEAASAPADSQPAPVPTSETGGDWTQPTTVALRLGDAMQLLCGGKRPPDHMVQQWLDNTSESLQEFAASNGPAWAQGIGLIDAAMVMVDQPTEITTIESPDRDHEHRAASTPADRVTAPAGGVVGDDYGQLRRTAIGWQQRAEFAERNWEKCYRVALIHGADHSDFENKPGAHWHSPTPPTQAADSVLDDAELGRIAMRFVDRAGDPHPGIDDAETICREFHAAMSAVLDPRFQRRMGAARKQGDHK